MSRLPTPGSDDNTWGDLLNDFLHVEHNADGTLKKAGDIEAARVAANTKYTIPVGGVPRTDLANDVRNSLDQADLRNAVKLQSFDISPAPPADQQVLMYDQLHAAWTPHTVSSSGVPDATATVNGVIRLAGDLAGVAAAPTVPGLAAKANDNAVVHLAANETVSGTKDFTGGLTVNSAAVIVTSDSRLSDARVPTNASVTDAKITASGLTNAAIAASAAIAKSKLASLAIVDADVSAISQTKITGLSTTLSTKVDTGIFTAKGDLLTATAAGTVVNLPVGANGLVLQADNTQTAGLSWVNAPDVIHVGGLTADGTTDDGPTIQAVLNTIGVSGNHSFDIIVEAPATGTVYINSTIQVQSNNTRLRFGSALLYGPNGRIRIEGELAEIPATGKPYLSTAANAGDTTITISNTAPFTVGSYIIIRGSRDSTGNVPDNQKEYHTVIAISGNVLTLNEPLEDGYITYNANPGTPASYSHNTEVTRIVSSVMTVAAVRGDRTVTINDTGIFAVGDYVQVLDDTHTINTSGVEETSNYKHREVAKIKQIVSSTQLRLSHALYHTYDLAKNARVAKMLPVQHSSIADANVTWSAMSAVNNAFEIRYGVECSLTNCLIAGDGAKTKSWRNQAFRQADSYFCQVRDCYATDPADTSSGRGYGATFYGCTQCTLLNSRFSSNRHSVLFFNGAAGNTVSNCISEDVCLSDYDMHGAECTDNLITGCTAIGGDSLATDGALLKAACRIGNSSHTDGDFHNVFNNMLIVNYQGTAFEVVPSSGDNSFRNSRVMGAQTGLKLISNSSNTALISTDTFVDNVDFVDINTAVTNVNGNATTIMVRGLSIDNCRFIRATTGLAVLNAQRVRLRRNSFYDSNMPAGSYGISANAVTSFSARYNDISNGARGVRLTGCPAARVSGNILHDMAETVAYEDAGGNTGALFGRNEIYGFTPTILVSGTGSSAGGIADVGVPYTPDTPARHAYVEWNYDPIIGGSGSAPVSGIIYVMKLTAQTGGVINNIIATISSVSGVSLTAGQNFAALYNAAGTRIGLTADQSTAWTTNGLKTMALTAAATIQGGGDYYVALVVNGTTPPSFIRSGTNLSGPNAGQGNAQQRFSVNGSGTSMPTTITLSSNSAVGAITFWMALS